MVVRVPEELIEAIRTFPVQPEVEHCGSRFTASPFDFSVDCPRCGVRIKVRSFSAGGEIDGFFDAVFEWMNRPLAQDEARRRQTALKDDEETESAGGSSLRASPPRERTGTRTPILGLAPLLPGIGREPLLGKFEEVRQQLRREDREADEDAVMDVLEFLTGWCSPHTRIPLSPE